MCFIYTLTYKSEREMGKEEDGREGESRSLQTDAGSQGSTYVLPQICCVIHPNVFKPLRTSVPLSPVVHARCFISNAWQREGSLYGLHSNKTSQRNPASEVLNALTKGSLGN